MRPVSRRGNQHRARNATAASSGSQRLNRISRNLAGAFSNTPRSQPTTPLGGYQPDRRRLVLPQVQARPSGRDHQGHVLKGRDRACRRGGRRLLGSAACEGAARSGSRVGRGADDMRGRVADRVGRRRRQHGQEPEPLRPTTAEFGRMTTAELVIFVDAGWQQLRSRLATPPPGRKPVD